MAKTLMALLEWLGRQADEADLKFGDDSWGKGRAEAFREVEEKLREFMRENPEQARVDIYAG